MAVGVVPEVSPLTTALIGTGVAVGCTFAAGAAVGSTFAAPASGAEVGAAAEPQAKIRDRTRNNVMWICYKCEHVV